MEHLKTNSIFFEGQFDEYVPLNSKINVEDRRTVVAVSVVSTASVATMGVRSTMPVGGGAPAGGGSAELAEAFKSENSRIRRIRKYKFIDDVQLQMDIFLPQTM